MRAISCEAGQTKFETVSATPVKAWESTEINSIEINSPKYVNILKQEFVMSWSNRDNNLRTTKVHLDKTIKDSGISKIVNRMESEIKKNKQLRKNIKRIKGEFRTEAL